MKMIAILIASVVSIGSSSCKIGDKAGTKLDTVIANNDNSTFTWNLQNNIESVVAIDFRLNSANPNDQNLYRIIRSSPPNETQWEVFKLGASRALMTVDFKTRDDWTLTLAYNSSPSSEALYRFDLHTRRATMLWPGSSTWLELGSISRYWETTPQTPVLTNIFFGLFADLGDPLNADVTVQSRNEQSLEWVYLDNELIFPTARIFNEGQTSVNMNFEIKGDPDDGGSPTSIRLFGRKVFPETLAPNQNPAIFPKYLANEQLRLDVVWTGRNTAELRINNDVVAIPVSTGANVLAMTLNVSINNDGTKTVSLIRLGGVDINSSQYTYQITNDTRNFWSIKSHHGRIHLNRSN